MKKIINKSTINWALGIIISCLGVCLSTKSNMGLSMIAASPYMLHVYHIDRYAWFTQGTAEYIWEAMILIAMCIIIRRFKPKYLLSFATAIIVGFVIDGWFVVLGGNGAYGSLTIRIITFILGMLVTSLGIAFYFRTSMPTGVYELFVIEYCDKYGTTQHKTKFWFDIAMLVICLLLAAFLTKSFKGLGPATVIMTFVNAPCIKFFLGIIDKVEKNETK